MSLGKCRNAETQPELVSQRILVLSNLLRRAAGLRYRRLLDLQAGEWGVVAELGHRSPCTLNDLAGRIGVDKTQLSRTVSRLIARGLVRRKPNPRDNREVRLSLTPKGEECYGAIMRAGAAANRSLLADLSPRGQEQLVELIDRITARARELLNKESS